VHQVVLDKAEQGIGRGWPARFPRQVGTLTLVSHSLPELRVIRTCRGNRRSDLGTDFNLTDGAGPD